MPRLTDLSIVRACLDRDRDWAAYALGDLSPGLVDYCDWHTLADVASPSEMLLLYRGFTPPIVFAMGEPLALRTLFAELRAPEIALHIRSDALLAMAGSYTPTATRHMRRMSLRRTAYVPVAHDGVRPIGTEDLAAVAALYNDGHRRGEGPTFFDPAMLEQRTFRGIWEDGALVAIAGTHLYSRDVGVCAIGNVYTRGDRRGRGLGARVTSAVAAHALAEGARTIVLNVGTGNAAAQRVYERLGFEVYCEFLEGEATRVSGCPAEPSVTSPAASPRAG